MKCSLSLIQPLFIKRATLAEKEVSALKEQLAVANQSGEMAQSAQVDHLPASSLEIELSAKDKEISQLLEDVQRLQASMNKLQENSANQIARLEEELEKKRQHILHLEAKLEAQKDYSELKRRLCSIKMCEEGKQQPEPEKKEETKSPSAASTPSELPGEVPTLHNVETFGSFLGEEIVSKWRQSLERTIVSQSARPTPPPYSSCFSEDSNKAKAEPVEREGRSVSPSADDLVNGNVSPAQTPDAETSASTINNNNTTSNNNNNNNNNTTSNNNLPNGLSFGVNLNNNVLGTGGGLSLNEVIKSPFRFDDRSPFRYSDDPSCMVGRFGESLIPKGDPMEARLQEMLRYNMDKYANQNLDTLHIARRVRELLSIHNVGQRLFAKYVLGLSQGTVSELLSKPKPWDKLTEKGRDSYRKMHAWACDDNAVLLLKSLIPKKGKDPSMGNVLSSRGESEMTEERIAHILNEASSYIKPQCKEETPSNEDSQSPNHPQSAESPGGRDSIQHRRMRKYDTDEMSQEQNRRLKKYENDDISQEQVVRIYHEELVKLMGRRLEDQPFPGLMFPHFLSSGAGEDVRLAMDSYHRELAKLNSNPAGTLPFPLAAMHQQVLSSQNGMAQDLSMPKQDRKDKNVNGEEKKEGDRHGGSAFSLVRPKVEPSSPLGNVILPPEDMSSTTAASTAAVSPLQRMASITNSLISQPPTQHHHTPSQRPLKAVLPPITQQQFDQFNNLNTEEIVRKVKEQLSQFSISQRLFGESVLGLSQGSVSDLLARPKPWHMLTQKGREPFIRMKMFLEDSNAVHKLVASQYKIAPEKLMRTGGYGVNPSPHTKPVSSNCGKYGGGIMQSSPTLHVPHSNPPPPPVPPLTPPDIKKCNIPPQHNQPSPQIQPFTPMKNIQHPAAPSVYEMAALTQELDTQGITTKIKEALLANNIGQKIFGEAVLGLSQGSVSELLSKPKPWHMLSIKGREPFIRMQLWLSDSHNIDRLQAIKSERRELNKRRRGSGQQDNSSDTSSNDTSEFYQSSANSPPSSKKQRVLFSEEQKEALKIAFALDPYPSVATIEFLANDLNLVSRAISNWFHNHRMRLKQIPHGETLNREGQGSGFDPVKFRMLLSQRLGIQTPFSAASQYFPPHSTDSGNLSSLSGMSQEQREEVSGLDLTVKHEDEFEDNESHLDSEDSYSGVPETRPPEPRSSRRKPAAPQWVNPDWQQEVIINGVCVMQTEDFEREGREETVRVEPTPVPEEQSTTPEPPAETSTEESKVVVKQEVKDEKWDTQF